MSVAAAIKMSVAAAIKKLATSGWMVGSRAVSGEQQAVDGDWAARAARGVRDACWFLAGTGSSVNVSCGL